MQAEVALMICNVGPKGAVYCTRNLWWLSCVIHKLQESQEVVARSYTIKESPKSTKRGTLILETSVLKGSTHSGPTCEGLSE